MLLCFSLARLKEKTMLRNAYDSLIAAAGGVELEESNERPSDLATYGSPSSMPVLSDGPLRMAQSGAIERYISDISPKFAGLTAQQRAVDSMFGAIKEVSVVFPITVMIIMILPCPSHFWNSSLTGVRAVTVVTHYGAGHAGGVCQNCLWGQKQSS